MSRPRVNTNSVNSTQQISSPYAIRLKLEGFQHGIQTVYTIATFSLFIFILSFATWFNMDFDEHFYDEKILNFIFNVCLLFIIILSGFSTFSMSTQYYLLQSKYQSIIDQNFNLFSIDLYREYLKDTNIIQKLSRMCLIISFLLIYTIMMLHSLIQFNLSENIIISFIVLIIGIISNILSALKIYQYDHLIPCYKHFESKHLTQNFRLSAISQSIPSHPTPFRHIHTISEELPNEWGSPMTNTQPPINPIHRNTNNINNTNNPNNSNSNLYHQRRISITNQSMTASEMTEMTMDTQEFDSRERAMMRIASGNVFDYKTDIIQEEPEDADHEIGHNPINNLADNNDDELFSYVNSDGVEESDHDEDELAISDYRENDDGTESGNGTSETSEVEQVKEKQVELGDVTEQENEEETKHEETDKERELIDVITVAMANEPDSEQMYRMSTATVLRTAEELLGGINPPSSHDEDDEEESYISHEDEVTALVIDKSSNEHSPDDVSDPSTSNTDEYVHPAGNKYNILTMFRDSVDTENDDQQETQKQLGVKDFFLE